MIQKDSADVVLKDHIIVGANAVTNFPTIS